MPGAALLAAGIAGLSRFTAEDAYITARYAETLVRTGRLEFNAGEPINALTSPLHALLEAALYAATGDTVGAYKIVATLCLLLTAVLVARALRGSAVAQATGLLIVAAPCVVLWTMGGLETPLLMLGTTGLTLLLMNRPRAHAPFWAAVVAAGCVLARYDAVLFAGPVMLGVWWRATAREVAGAAVARLALVGAWMGVCWTLYGDVLPTSFYVKTPGVSNVAGNAAYIVQYLALVGVLPAFAVAAWRRRSGGAALTPPLPDAPVVAIWVGLACTGLYALMAVTTHMMFSFRLGVPFVPVLALLAGRALARAPQRWGASVAWVSLLAVLQAVQLAGITTRSINGPLWEPGGSQAHTRHAEAARATAYEYTEIGAWRYTDGFMHALDLAADAIRVDWAASPHPARPLRLWTFAAGRLPYQLPESHVFEVLVSHRRGCIYPYHLGLSADYLHILTPGHGSVEKQLPFAALPGQYRLVFSARFPFNGQTETMQVYRNAAPRPNPLPPRLRDACAERDSS